MSIEITTKTKVFDHPEFCTSEESLEKHPNDSATRCPKLGDYDKEGWCYLFDVWVDSEKPWRKCHECLKAYQKALKEKEPDLEKELHNFMGKTFGEQPKPFHVFISEQYPDIEYQYMMFDEKGAQLHPPVFEVVPPESKSMMRTFIDDMMSLYGIEVSEVDKLKNTGEECEFDCEERGIELMKGKTLGDCKKCPNTPPF